MRQMHVRFLLLLSLTLLLASYGVAVRSASSADCSDSLGPCSCGDDVRGDKHLSGADPVTSTVCQGLGLRLNFGTLDFNGHTIRGAGNGVGVELEFGGEIRGGTITGFEFGILGFEVRGSQISGMRLLDNWGVGIDLCCESSGNVIKNVLIEGGGLAVRITGGRGGHTLESMTIRDTEGIVTNGGIPDFEGELRSGNRLVGNRVEDTRGDGIIVFGFHNIVARNVVIGSAGDGIVIANFGNNTVNNNQVTLSGGHGLRFEGREHTVFRNVSKNNAGDGLFVEATDSTFERNQSLNNDGFGIEDTTIGDGTADTTNTYTLNVCYSANALGKSSPAGLCR